MRVRLARSQSTDCTLLMAHRVSLEHPLIKASVLPHKFLLLGEMSEHEIGMLVAPRHDLIPDHAVA